ncbi:DNA binding protein [Dorcoceras hygrometricum]|uniref:DNA binding protein n=1 Tax=Dorcoceras hygrometricum TaxID=472368 RepID=A0A2Z7C1P6_9LAMI|nr:DNA binding protein [Dorcoceras hygrometricum]
MTIHRVFLGVTFLATRAWLRPVSRGNRHFTVGGGRLRQSGPRPETISLRSACNIRLKDFIANGFSSKSWPEQVRRTAAAAAGTGGGVRLEKKVGGGF